MRKINKKIARNFEEPKFKERKFNKKRQEYISNLPEDWIINKGWF